MELSPAAEIVRIDLDKYVDTHGIAWNPDVDVTTRVLNGLAKREEKTGERYCPCRLTTGNSEEDAKIICPCVYHCEEIARDGMCHCQLFVAEGGATEAGTADCDKGGDNG